MTALASSFIGAAVNAMVRFGFGKLDRRTKWDSHSDIESQILADFVNFVVPNLCLGILCLIVTV